MISKTEVRPGGIGDKSGWCFDVYFGRDYPGLISALFKTKREAQNELCRYIKTGEYVTYGSAE